MPSRSSRSMPASRTSWSDPTGPASLAIAIGGTLATGRAVKRGVSWLGRRRLCRRRFQWSPVVGLAKLSQVLSRRVGVEHRRIVGRDRAANARCDELRQRMLLERSDDAGAEVRERTDVEDG